MQKVTGLQQRWCEKRRGENLDGEGWRNTAEKAILIS
jgi:hypothetical protein